MKITAMEEYGLRCMVQLAMANTDGPVTVTDIAEPEGLSTEYAGKLLNMLRQADLVKSVRGRNGGFVLGRPANEISLASIMRVFSPDLFDEEYCDRHTGAADTCVHTSSCAIRPVLHTLSKVVNRTLESMTLMDLLCGEAEVHREMSEQSDRLSKASNSGSPLIQIT
jgi:Rrf2 family protein